MCGGFQAERDGQAVPDSAWQRRGGRQLVKLLATSPNHRLHREQVQDLLWPHLPPESGGAAVRKALHHARHALEPDLAPRGDSTFIHLRDDIVSLAESTVWIDANAFEALAESALETGSQERLEHAIDAYRGELLPEDRYEAWTTLRREALAELHMRLLVRLADVHEQAWQASTAIDRLQQVLAHDPGREDLHRRVMRLLARDGRRHQALRQYQACREAMRNEFNAPPASETEELYQELLAGRVGPESGGGSPTEPVLRLTATVSRQPAAMMVGRDSPFGSMIDALRLAASGQGGAVLVSGEAGVGKSRLVAEVARRAYDNGALVLWGSAFEQEGQLPYGPLVEALDGAIAAQRADRREDLISRFPDLKGLLPTLRSAEGDGHNGSSAPDTASRDGRMRLITSVAALLDELTRGRPMMLVLDDLHSADTAVIQVFELLARIAGDRRWLLVGTYRSGYLATRRDLMQLLSSLGRDRRANSLELERLARDETDRLTANLLPDGVVSRELLEAVFARSLGNPLFVQELIRSMREEGALTLAEGQWVVVPDAAASVPKQVRVLIDGRIDRLGDDVRDALTLISAAGMECSFQLMRDAGQLDESQLLDALDRALEANLLEERDDGYAFQHPLVRATLYEQISRPRRARLHAALATTIERVKPSQRTPIEALAFHWSEAGDAGRAVPYLLEAADRATRVYANSEAINHLRLALHLAGTIAEGSEGGAINTAETMERLGDLHALIGEAEPARGAYAEAIAHANADPLHRARLRRKAGLQSLFAGSVAAAGILLDEASADLELLADDPRSRLELARTLATRAQCDFLAFRFAEALASGEESLRLAEAAGSPPDVARACQMVAMACLPLGEWQRGLAFERRFGSLTDLDLTVRDSADVHLCLSEYHLYGDQPAEAARAFLRTLDEAERVGATRSLALCQYYLGNMAYFRGRFHEGLERLDKAIALYRQIASGSGEAIAIMMRGLTLTALGRLDEAHQEMQSGLARAESSTLRSHALIRLYAGLGRNRLDANDPASARDYAERALALAEEPSDCICYAAFHPMATAAFALTGDLDRAAEIGDRALEHARAIGSAPLLCMAHQATGLVHGLTGDWDEAFSSLDDARNLASEFNLPYELGRTLLMRSFVHTQRRRPRDLAAASTLTAQAWPILLRLGVRASTAQARSSLGFMRGHLRRQPDESP